MKKWQIFDDENHSMTSQKTQGALESCKIETVQHTVIFFNIKSFWRKHRTGIGILLSKLFWPTLRKNCSTDRKKGLKFEAEGQEFAKVLISLEQFIQTVKG